MFAHKARAAGIDVELQVWDGMIHVFQMFGAELAEARQAISSIAKFLNGHLQMNADRRPQ
jgi:acetyl esterase/lipase